MKNKEEWARKWSLDMPSLFESKLLDDTEAQRLICSIQVDTLRWAADVAKPVDESLAAVLRDKADSIKKIKKEKVRE